MFDNELQESTPLKNRARIYYANLEKYFNELFSNEFYRRTKIKSTYVGINCPHETIFDCTLHIPGANSDLALVRIDAMSIPAAIHLFPYLYEHEDTLKQILEFDKDKIANAVGKKEGAVSIDHYQNFKAYDILDTKLKRIFTQFVDRVKNIKKDNSYRLENPEYTFDTLPNLVHLMGKKIPKKLLVSITRKKSAFSREICCLFELDHLNEDISQHFKVNLFPDLGDPYEGPLSPAVKWLCEELGSVFKKGVTFQFLPLS